MSPTDCSRRGVHDVDLSEVIAHAGVDETTLASHFPTKDELVLAVLDLRGQRWTVEFVETEARRLGTTPEDQLLAIFDVFDRWFHQDDFDACTFINILLEMGWDHPLGRACVAHLENIRNIVATLAKEAELNDPDRFARSWHILMKGSIISAAEGDFESAQLAKELGRSLIQQHRRNAPEPV